MGQRDTPEPDIVVLVVVVVIVAIRRPRELGYLREEIKQKIVYLRDNLRGTLHAEASVTFPARLQYANFLKKVAPPSAGKMKE